MTGREGAWTDYTPTNMPKKIYQTWQAHLVFSKPLHNVVVHAKFISLEFVIEPVEPTSFIFPA